MAGDELPLTEAERQREIAAVEKRIAELDKLWQELNPLYAFEPNPPQYRLIQSLVDNIEFTGNRLETGRPEVRIKKDIFAPLWGNGNGKSWMAVVLTGNIIYGPQNKWFDHPLFRDWPFDRHLRWVCPSADMKEGTGELWKAIVKWWPKDRYKLYKSGYDHFSYGEFFDESGKKIDFMLDVRTFEQDLILHEGASLGMMLMNEPSRDLIWRAYGGARFRQGGFRVLAATCVLDESYWVMEDVLENPKAWVDFSDNEENCAEHGRLTTPLGVVTGKLPHVYVQQRMDNYPEDQKQARRTGRPIFVQGLLFDFDEAAHLIPRAELPEELTCRTVLDPHPARPWAMLVGGQDELGNYYIVDEWPRMDTFNGKLYHQVNADRRGVEEYAQILSGLAAKWGVDEQIIDGKFANSPIRVRSMTTTLRDQLLELGQYFHDGDPQVAGDGGGIRRLQQLLRYDRSRPLDYTNRPKFYIVDDCRNCITGLKNITRRKRPDGSGYTDKLDDKFLDFPRCMMYLVMHRGGFSPVAVGSTVSQRRRLFLDRLSEQTGRDYGLVDTDYDGEGVEKTATGGGPEGSR